MTVEQPFYTIDLITDVEMVENLRPVLESTIVYPGIANLDEETAASWAADMAEEVDEQLAAIRAAVGNPAMPYYVATMDGKPVGVMGFRAYTPPDVYPNGWDKPAEVVHTHVAAEHQGHRIGSALLQYAVFGAKRAGYHELAVPSGSWRRWGKTAFWEKMFDRTTWQENPDESQNHGVFRKRIG